MVVRSRYAAGDAVLCGVGDRWLLLTDPGDERVVAELWDLLSAPSPNADSNAGSNPNPPALAERVLEVVERAFGTAPFDLVLLDLSSDSAHVVARGAGRSDAEAQVRRLVLGDEPVAGTLWPFVGGVVAASGLELRNAQPSEEVSEDQSESPPAVLIDGIPARILAAKGPEGPPPRRTAARPPAPTPAAESGEHTADPVEGTTVIRSPHLLAAEPLERVLAVRCPVGHLTPPEAPLCRVCRARVAPQEAHQVPRPVLGGLRLPTGEVIALDRGVVLGRRPQAPPTATDWPHLVVVPAPHTFVSRSHVHVWPAGWHVVAQDLGSRGGTLVQRADGGTEPLLPDQPRPLAPGNSLVLADYRVRFEVDPGPTQRPAAPAPEAT